MSQSILSPGSTPGISTEVVVNPPEIVVLSVYTDTGEDIGSGPVLTLQKMDINGNFISVCTVEYGKITFSKNSQHLTILTPGTFRVVRPDISAWNYNIGIEEYRYSPPVPPDNEYNFSAGTFQTDYTGLDSLSGGTFPDIFVDQYSGGIF